MLVLNPEPVPPEANKYLISYHTIFVIILEFIKASIKVDMHNSVHPKCSMECSTDLLGLYNINE